MSENRTSIIWTLGKEELQKIVRRETSLAGVMRYFGLVTSGAAYRPLKARMDMDGVDYSHIRLGKDSNKGRKFEGMVARPLGQVMVEKSTYSRSSLKKRLLKNGMLRNECSVCGQQPEWQGKPLVLVLDHINGVNDDNRMENLRIVCPNCDSQLDTTTGKNKRRRKNCLKCGKVIWKTSFYCRHCNPNKALKVRLEDRPSRENLEKMVKDMPMASIGRKYGVSDNAIRRWCRASGVVLEKKHVRSHPRFCSCGKRLSVNSKTGKCLECFRFASRKVVQRPSREELERDISCMSRRAVSRKYGVAHTTLEKWRRVYGMA